MTWENFSRGRKSPTFCVCLYSLRLLSRFRIDPSAAGRPKVTKDTINPAGIGPYRTLHVQGTFRIQSASPVITLRRSRFCRLDNQVDLVTVKYRVYAKLSTRVYHRLIDIAECSLGDAHQYYSPVWCRLDENIQWTREIYLNRHPGSSHTDNMTWS